MLTKHGMPVAIALGLLWACSSSTSGSKHKDAGSQDAGARGDGGGAGSGAAKAGVFGAACKKAADCGKGLSCDPEVDNSIKAQGLPAGMKQVASSSYPGGSCTPVPAAAFDPNGVRSCNPLLPQAQQGCGADGACVTVPVGTKTEVACRPLCNPAAAKNECGRFGYACDFEMRACVEGCQSDEECRLQLTDANNDGRADGLQYDATSKAICDTESFRCVLHGGGAAASTGAACKRLDDCEADGLCLQSLQTYGGLPFPDGYCTKLGCDLKGHECSGNGAVCTSVRAWSPGVVTPSACFQGCAVGAEPKADQLGESGHGKGCRTGYRCHYNGGATGSDQGVCVGGNYNSVTASNIGAACKTDADCFSPFGLGSCLTLSVGGMQPATGVCGIMDCAVPGLPDNICGSGSECIGLSGDITFCAKTCTDAAECATGYACADDDQDTSTPKICYPVCFGNDDCRKGTERCSSTSATNGGTCVASVASGH
jgi:hypothetical protein